MRQERPHHDGRKVAALGGAQRAPYGLKADEKGRALVAQVMAETSGAIARAVGESRYGDRAGAGDQKIAATRSKAPTSAISGSEDNQSGGS
jgi:hypothetical protein